MTIYNWHIIIILVCLALLKGDTKQFPECIMTRREPMADLTKEMMPKKTEDCKDHSPVTTGKLNCEVRDESNGKVQIKYKCVCPYHVFNNSDLDYLCFAKEDFINQMTCNDCKSYSNGTGPCLNGGRVKCPHHSPLASDLECHCPFGTTGRFCQKKQNVVCHRVHSQQKDNKLPYCELNSSLPCLRNNNQHSQYKCTKIAGSDDSGLRSCDAPSYHTDSHVTRSESSRTSSVFVSLIAVVMLSVRVAL